LHPSNETIEDQDRHDETVDRDPLGQADEDQQAAEELELLGERADSAVPTFATNPARRGQPGGERRAGTNSRSAAICAVGAPVAAAMAGGADTSSAVAARPDMAASATSAATNLCEGFIRPSPG
jgi:hypothetical protein